MGLNVDDVVHYDGQQNDMGRLTRRAMLCETSRSCSLLHGSRICYVIPSSNITDVLKLRQKFEPHMGPHVWLELLAVRSLVAVAQN